MTDEFTLRRDADRMAKADRLLKDDLLNEILDGLIASYTAAWAATLARDTQGREICYLARKAAEGVRDDIRRTLTDGKIALHELAAIDKREGAA